MIGQASWTAGFALLCTLRVASAASKGFRFIRGYERVLVQPFGYDGFRIRASPYRDPTGDEISMLYDPPLEGPENGAPIGLGYDDSLNTTAPTSVTNGNMVAACSGSPAYKLSFYRKESNGTMTYLTGDYWPLKALNPRYYTFPWPTSSFAAEFSFDSTPDELILGTGQQQDFLINHKGQTNDLLNFNSYIPLPVFMSNKGYLLYWNMPSEGRMEFSPSRTRFTTKKADVVDYYITASQPGDYDLLQRRYSAATGRSPIPPEFSLGYLQSKLRYYNQSEVESVARKFVEYDIPVEMIVIDYLAWKYQGDWSFDPALWPDPASMATYVKNMTGAELMVSLWPSVEDKSVNYMDLITQGLLAFTRDGPGVSDSWEGVYTRLYDATHPQARKFLFDTLYRNYFTAGIHNFWIDQADGAQLGEAYNNNGQPLAVQSIPTPRTQSVYHAGSQDGVGRLYPWCHQAAIEEGHRNVTNTTTGEPCEYLSLSRSTFAGGQRFCSMVWSGDTQSNWETLGNQIPAGLSMASSGISWWTLDIGGFQADPTISWSANIDTPEMRELFTRWFQFGTFLPFQRVHGSRACNTQTHFTCDNEPWSYGNESLAINKKYIQLRRTLKPYIAQLFTDLHETGKPIMRPLIYDFDGSDPEVVEGTRQNANFTTQQYMFGSSILVAPVTLPNITTWSVYLPKVANQPNASAPWTYWWDNSTHAGGQTVNVSAPLSDIPLFHLGSRAEILSPSGSSSAKRAERRAPWAFGAVRA